MTSSTPLQRAVETLVDLSSMQRESIDRMGDRMDAGFARLTASQEHLAQTVDNLGQTVDRLVALVDRLTARN